MKRNEAKLWNGVSDMKTKQIYRLDEISRMAAPVAAAFGVRKLSIFGSYARGEASENSDIDFHLIDCGSIRGLIELAAFELALEDIFDVPVDVVTTGGLFDDVRNNIQREERIIYEA